MLQTKEEKTKMYAIIRNGYVHDGWFAETLEEAQKDNPGDVVVEVTVENSPWHFGEKYTQKK